MESNTTNIRYYELTASEFDWKVSEEKTIKAWGFNNSIPGPVIKANQGETLVIKVKNNLTEPTVVHWHGIRLPSSMDGTDDAQMPIEPGEAFEYSFVVPDAGTFWYHSHQNETVQMERGMYGALIVEEKTDIVVDAERIFMIDDVKLDPDNEFKKGNVFQRWLERHDGRQGNTLLVNGKENSVIEMCAGQTERWRFINASSAKYFHLHLSGKQFKIIATDGGLLERPEDASEVLLTPGERVEIIVGPFDEGEMFNIESLPYNRMTSIKPKHDVYASVKVGAFEATKAFIPGHFRNIETLATQDSAVTRQIKFSVDLSLKHGIDFRVNDHVHTDDKPVNVGELQVWEVANTSLMDHPFHLHGFFFQVIDDNGKKPAYKAWKDTYNLKPRSKIKIAWIPDNPPGMWMYHCHILEHHAAGMMAHFEVVDPGKGELFAGLHHHHKM